MIHRSENHLTRRHFLQGTSALSLSLMLGESFSLHGGEALQRRQISQAPILLETPLAALAQPNTPNDLHYVRNHFPAPTLQAKTWGLCVGGRSSVSWN